MLELNKRRVKIKSAFVTFVRLLVGLEDCFYSFPGSSLDKRLHGFSLSQFIAPLSQCVCGYFSRSLSWSHSLLLCGFFFCTVKFMQTRFRGLHILSEVKHVISYVTVLKSIENQQHDLCPWPEPVTRPSICQTTAARRPAAWTWATG